MNILKKQDITLPLFQQVTQRVITTFKANISFYKKKLLKDFYKVFFSSLIISGVSGYIANIFHNIYGYDMFYFTIVFSFISLFLGVLSIGTLIDLYHSLHVLKKSLTEMNNYKDQYYKYFKHQLNENLNSEEIQSLFSFELSFKQRQFLEKIIIQNNNLDLSVLEKLPFILSEEEEKQLQLERDQGSLKNEQRKLTDFFEKHQITPSQLTQAAQLQLMKQSNTEKKMELSSLL